MAIYSVQVVEISATIAVLLLTCISGGGFWRGNTRSIFFWSTIDGGECF